MAKEAESTVVPKLRFPEFRGDWSQLAVGNFFNLTDEMERPSGFDRNRLLTVKLHTNGVVKNEKSTLTGGASYFTRRAGQFIFSKIDLLNGAFGIVPNALDGFASSTDVPAFSFTSKHSSTFFLNWLKAMYSRLEVERTGTSSTLKRVSVEKFLALELRAPALAEQQKIADCLTSLDEVIAAQRRRVEALKTYKRGLMQQLFPRDGETIPRLRFPEFRDAPEWVTKELGPMTEKVGSGITPLGGDRNYRAQGRPFVRSQNVGWGELLLSDVVYIDEETHRAFDATEIRERDVLLNITGASIGRSAVADSRVVGGNVNQHVCIIRTKADELNPVFLNQFLISERGQEQTDAFQAGGNRQGLNFAQIRSFEIPIPASGAEQQRVADCLTSLDAATNAEDATLEALRSHKAGLMQGLFPTLEEAQ